MKEEFNTSPKVVIDPDEYIRLLGYPIGHELTGRALELSIMTREWFDRYGQPWVYFRKADSFLLNQNSFTIDGITFESKAVLDRFHKAQVNDVYLVAVSAGKECEERANVLWRDSKPDEYFFMEMYGSAVVENLIMQTSVQLSKWADEQNLAVLPHYSPGYAEWDVIDQLKLIDLIKSGHVNGQLKVNSLDSGMLKPKKSLLAIIGVTQEQSKLTLQPGMIPCEKCALKDCQYRRKPYRFRKENQQASPTNRKLPDVKMEINVNYTLKEKVLSKWAIDRLGLKDLPNNEIQALFVYDGTTCSGTGFPLKFEYTFLLVEENMDFRIKDMNCRPAEKDIGHTKMCSYIKQGDAILQKVSAEKQCLGKTLTEVINQKVEFTPSGCYCDKNGRDYKLHQICQVLHFAMTKKRKEINPVEKVA